MLMWDVAAAAASDERDRGLVEMQDPIDNAVALVMVERQY